MASSGAGLTRRALATDPGSVEIAEAVVARQVRMVFGRVPLSA